MEINLSKWVYLLAGALTTTTTWAYRREEWLALAVFGAVLVLLMALGDWLSARNFTLQSRIDRDRDPPPPVRFADKR